MFLKWYHTIFSIYFSGNLRKHMTKHTGERPYHCETCDKSFAQKSSLNLHRIIHTGQKPYACELCEFHCNVRGNLKKHMMKHTGEKPFTCEVCFKAFSQKSSLKTHMSVHASKSDGPPSISQKNHVAEVISAVSKLPQNASSSVPVDVSEPSPLVINTSPTGHSNHPIYSATPIYSPISGNNLHAVYTTIDGQNASHVQSPHPNIPLYSPSPIKDEVSSSYILPHSHPKYTNHVWRS